MLALLQTAINRRSIVSLDYPPGIRRIEPHCLGRGRNGQLLLRAYQVEGASASGEPSNWKLFLIGRALQAALTGETFSGTRPLYNPTDPAMRGGIIAAL